MTPPITSRKISGVRVGNGPLCQYLALYRSHAEELGYESYGVHCRLRFIAKLDLWLRRNGKSLHDLDEALVETFCEKLRRRQPRNFTGARTTFRQLLHVLRENGAIPPPTAMEGRCPALKVADEYRRFASEQRGLDRSTIYDYSRHVDRFLLERFGEGAVDLGQITARDITTFVRKSGARFSRGLTAQIITGMRSFLRFARYRDYIKSDLAVAVPAV